MEVMYSCKPNNGYFLKKNFIGFYGELEDLSILVDNLEVREINKQYKVKKYVKYNEEVFGLLDLDRSFLNKKIGELGYSEFKLVCLLSILDLKPSLVIFNYFDVGFNYMFKRKLNKFIKYLNASMGINFIIITNDCLFMNKCCKHVIVCKDKIIKFQGDVNSLIEEGFIDKPPIYVFIDKANECGANLSYTLDSKELLKDIYRSVF